MAQRRKLLGELALSAMGMKDAFRPEGRAVQNADSATEREAPTTETAKSRTPPDETTCEGKLIGIERSKIVGWAWDAANPYEPVDIELFIGGVRAGYGTADRFDAELAATNRGNGMHRFELGLSRLPDVSPPFVVRAVIAGTEKELEPALTLSTITDAERLLAGSEYIGRVTGILNGSLCGWILNRDNPHEQPALTLWDGNTKIITGSVVGRSREVIDTGATKKVHRFELPLPPSALDGAQHSFSVRIGTSGPELSGSPVQFGPADVASMGKMLTSLSERLQRLDLRLDFFQPELDHAAIEKRITTQILDRVDMLLNIHRDGIERELAVMRRQITELFRLTPGTNPDVIAPIAEVPAQVEERVPSAREFTVIARSEPRISFDLDARPETATPLGGLKWQEREGSPGVAIKGSGRIRLEGVPQGPATIVLKGSGARDPLEFCGIVPAFQDRILTGRVEVDGRGNWAFIGSTYEGVDNAPRDDGLALTYLSDVSRPASALSLRQIAIYALGRAPERIEPLPPQSTTIYLGPENEQGGWYSFEPGPRGGHCWMAEHGNVAFRIRQTGRYELRIPEIRPLAADIMPKLRLVVGGIPMESTISATAANPPVFEMRANFPVAHQESDVVRIRLSFPKECVKSPMELGLNSDQRRLTIAVRSIFMNALDG